MGEFDINYWLKAWTRYELLDGAFGMMRQFAYQQLEAVKMMLDSMYDQQK